MTDVINPSLLEELQKTIQRLGDCSESFPSTSTTLITSLFKSLDSDSDEEISHEEEETIGETWNGQTVFDNEDDDVAYFEFLSNGALLEVLKKSGDSNVFSETDSLFRTAGVPPQDPDHEPHPSDEKGPTDRQRGSSSSLTESSDGDQPGPAPPPRQPPGQEEEGEPVETLPSSEGGSSTSGSGNSGAEGSSGGESPPPAPENPRRVDEMPIVEAEDPPVQEVSRARIPNEQRRVRFQDRLQVMDPDTDVESSDSDQECDGDDDDEAGPSNRRDKDETETSSAESDGDNGIEEQVRVNEDVIDEEEAAELGEQPEEPAMKRPHDRDDEGPSPSKKAL